METQWGILQDSLGKITHEQQSRRCTRCRLHIAQLLEVKLDNSWYQKMQKLLFKKLKA